MRDAAINLRALPEQRDLIDQAASLLGKNQSDFMLRNDRVLVLCSKKLRVNWTQGIDDFEVVVYRIVRPDLQS